MSLDSQNIQSKIEKDIVSNLIGSVVNDLQKQNRYVASQNSDDIYTTVQSLGYDVKRGNEIRAWNKNFKKEAMASKALVEILQKMIDEYTEKQVADKSAYIEQKTKDLGLIQTANPEFWVSKDGVYYTIEEDEFVIRKDIIDVDSDGHFTTQRNLSNNGDIIITTYNQENRPVIFKVLNKNRDAYTSEANVVKKLGLKQEFVKKYKLHGYSGNASGLYAVIGNMIFAPIPTGYYFDNSYNFFKWSNLRKQFEIDLRQGHKAGAPMLSDYDFGANKVIRTDYDGAGYLMPRK